MISEVLSNTFGININKTDGEYVLSNTFNIIINKISEVPVSSVSIFPKNHILKTLSSVQLTETILPRNATNKEVIWSSSDNNIANVSNAGLVTGVTAGDCIITATTVDGNKTDTCTITVIDSKPRISDVVVDITSHGSYELTYSVLGTGDNLIHKLKVNNGSYSNINPTKTGNIYKYSSGGLSNGEYICSIQVVDGDNTHTTNPFEILIEDPIDGIKGLLKISKDKYDVCHGILRVVIDSIVYDGKYNSETEKILLEESLNNYNNSLAKYNTVSQQCIDSIANKKANDAESNSNKYTEAKIQLTSDSILSTVSSAYHNKAYVDNEFAWMVKQDARIEQKADSINLKVEQNYYDKPYVDNELAWLGSETSRIEQKADSINLEVSKKVGIEEVKSTIRQSAGDVQIGFNGINDRININPRSMDFTAENGRRDMLLYGGQMCVYNNMDDTFVGTAGAVLNNINTRKGIGFLLGKNSNTFMIGRDANWTDILENRSPNPTEYFIIDFNNFEIRMSLPLFTGNINLQGHNIIGAKKASIMDLHCFGFKAHNTDKLMFRTDGYDMINGANWNWQYHNILNPKIIGGTYGIEVDNNSIAKFNTTKDMMLGENNIDLGKLVLSLVDEVNLLKEEISLLKNSK